MMNPSTSAPQKPRALVIWRLFGMVYDALPVIALWLLISAVFTVAYTYLGHHATRENIAPYSPLQILLWLVCWGVTGLYATISWRRGGQTLGMRPWRTRVISLAGGQPSWRALWLRFAMATLSLLAGGLGFWWAWWDPQRLTWHDRASGTRLIREPKLKR